eukprot:TRINITY_DN7042_c0_g1_i1.p1 TRINITY_DN7042_c0_g1~~TRINITY_DN7042_c0_g1_i1.p1  ORF type:complete len:491 (+),score=120.57 TRINITY_DN7042_c0_g1_i1:372-1844(+)
MKPNFLLPTQVALKEFDTPSSPVKEIYHSEDDSSVFWFKSDVVLKSPRANIFIHLSNPDLDSSDLSSTMAMRFCVNLIYDHLHDLAYMASGGGMQFGISLSQFPVGIKLEFTGYDNRLFELVQIVLENIISACKFLPSMPDRFNDIKESITLDLLTKCLDPSTYSQHLLELFLLDKAHDSPEAIDCVDSLGLPNVVFQLEQLLSSVFVSGLFHGNVEEVEARKAVAHVIEQISSPFPDGYRRSSPVERVIELDGKEEIYIQMPGKNLDNPNSAIVNFYMCGQDSLRERLKLRLLGSLLEEPCFDVLRTDQQLGYSVSCFFSNIEGVLAFQFDIVSADYEPATLDDRIEQFIREEYQSLQEMDKEEYEDSVNGLISDLQSQDMSVSDIGCRLWNEIEDRTMIFNRVDEEVSLLQNLPLEEVLDLYKSCLFDIGTRRKLSVQVYAPSKQEQFASKSAKNYPVNSPIKRTFLSSIEELVHLRNNRPLMSIIRD